jgi:hypothetical protein
MTKTSLLLLLFLSAVVLTASPDHPLAIVGGTVVDVSAFGSSHHDLADAIVLIRGGRIEAVGPRRSVPIPKDAQVLDAAGAFIVPGLSDVYATINNQRQANAFLYMGVTSIVGLDEPGGRRGRLFLDASPGPRVWRLETIIGYDPGALPEGQRTVPDLMSKGRGLSDAELREQVDGSARRGVKVLHLYYTLSPDQVRVVAARARARGLATIGELGATTYPQAIDAGVMAFVHTSRYSLELAPPALRDEVAKAPFGPPRRQYYEFLANVSEDDPRLARYARVLATGRTALIPTLAMNYLDLPGHRNPWKEPAAVLLDPKDIHLPANPETGERAQPADAVRDGFPSGATERLQVIESCYCKAGVKYLAGSGTDAFGTMPGISLHIELEMLVKACLTPRQALAAATANVGELFEWPTVGQVKPGYDADLLVLDADPTRDIGNLKRIRHVVLAGEAIDREALLRVGARR